MPGCNRFLVLLINGALRRPVFIGSESCIQVGRGTSPNSPNPVAPYGLN
jgi:hypothetical protein